METCWTSTKLGQNWFQSKFPFHWRNDRVVFQHFTGQSIGTTRCFHFLDLSQTLTLGGKMKAALQPETPKTYNISKQHWINRCQKQGGFRPDTSVAACRRQQLFLFHFQHIMCTEYGYVRPAELYRQTTHAIVTLDTLFTQSTTWKYTRREQLMPNYLLSSTYNEIDDSYSFVSYYYELVNMLVPERITAPRIGTKIFPRVALSCKHQQGRARNMHPICNVFCFFI